MKQHKSNIAQVHSYGVANLKLIMAAISVSAVLSGWAALSVARPVPKSHWINDPAFVRANASVKAALLPIAITRSSR